MDLKEIIKEINIFNIINDDDFEVTNFFDRIRNELIEFEIASEIKKTELLNSLFDYIKRQPPETDENWSLMYFIESIDHPGNEIYYKTLIEFNKKNGNVTSVILLNRLINTLGGTKKEQAITVLNMIYLNKKNSESVREWAKDFIEYQMEHN